MSTQIFYKNPIALDRNTHKDIKLTRQDSLEFAAETNSVPVAGFEFFRAGRDFPIVFIKNADDQFMAIALLSFKDKSHDLGEAWKNVYIPAFVRRYPFTLGKEGLVVFDSDAPHLNEAEGEALFDADKEPTSVLKEIVSFLKQTDMSYKATNDYTTALSEKGLLEPYKGEIRFTNTTVKLDQMYIINEKKLHASLNESELFEWFKKGWVAWSYAHLSSLASLVQIANRSKVSPEATPETPAKKNAEKGSAA